MKNLIIVLSVLCLVACKNDKGNKTLGADVSGIYMVAINQCNEIANVGVWAAYDNAQDAISIYTSEADCVLDSRWASITPNNVTTENPSQTGTIDYDPTFNTALAVALIFEGY